MSLKTPPTKRLKQSAISDFFGTPKTSLHSKAECMDVKRVSEGEEDSREGKSGTSIDPSGSPPQVSEAMDEETSPARDSTSSPSNSMESPLAQQSADSDENRKPVREPEQDKPTNSAYGQKRLMNGDLSESASASGKPGVDAAHRGTKDPKKFYSRTDERRSPPAEREVERTRDNDRSHSSGSNESRREVYPIPLDLEQEVGEMPGDLVRFPRDAKWKPGDLEDSAEHTVLIQTPYVPGSGVPKPSPLHCLDVWDQHHVKMPNSARSMYNDPNGVEIQRWDLIETTLLTPIHSFHDFRDAVLKYNGGFTWDMEELEDFLEEMSLDERRSFFDQLLPAIVNLALRLPSICTRPPPLLTKGKSHSITMSQVQASCILANAFLSTFPRRNTTKPESQFYNYPSINFHTLFNRCWREKRRSCRKEKLKCILNYFKRVTEKEPEGNITFTRIKLRCGLGWEASQARLQKAFVTSEGLIEDQGYGMLMVDFANRRVGGGVLRDGCVQEEILFVLYPELICARLFTETLEADEALLITGVERFNAYEGYSDEFKHTGNVVDLAERDPWGRKYTQFVAIDGLAFRGKRQQREQFSTDKVLRELVKAFCGFQTPGFPRSCLATGNWGCGAYGGDARLKFLIQWMAASRAGRQLTYFTFGNYKLMCELRALQGLITEHNINVGDLFLLLKRYDRLYISNETRCYPSLSEFLFRNFNPQDSE